VVAAAPVYRMRALVLLLSFTSSWTARSGCSMTNAPSASTPSPLVDGLLPVLAGAGPVPFGLQPVQGALLPVGGRGQAAPDGLP